MILTQNTISPLQLGDAKEKLDRAEQLWRQQGLVRVEKHEVEQQKHAVEKRVIEHSQWQCEAEALARTARELVSDIAWCRYRVAFLGILLHPKLN